MQNGLNQAGFYGATMTGTTKTGSGKVTISGHRGLPLQMQIFFI